MTPQIQKIREVCERLVEASRKDFILDAATEADEYVKELGDDCEYCDLNSGSYYAGYTRGRDFAANTSANLARSLMIAVDALDDRSCDWDIHDNGTHTIHRPDCGKCEALEQIAALIEGKL